MDIPKLSAASGFIRAHKVGAGVATGSILFLYWHHRKTVNSSGNSIAGPTDPTVAGAAQDQYGNQTYQSTSSMNGYDPYTSGYNGYGYDLLLGSGGAVSGSAGNNGSSVPIIQQAATQNPSTPGSTYSGPQSLTVSYVNPPTQTPVKTVQPPTTHQRDTVHSSIRQSMHNVKNGRHADKHRQNHHGKHHLRDENRTQVTSQL